LGNVGLRHRGAERCDHDRVLRLRGHGDYGSLENTWGTDATGSIPEIEYNDRLDETIDDQFFAY
jgi:hypothetical protein